MAFTVATLTHKFTDALGNAATGSVQFSLTKAMTNGSSTMLPASITATLDDTGAISQQVTANTDSGTSPPDAQWRVDLRLNSMDPLTYFITVPTGGGTIDLGTLLPSEGTSVPVDYTTQWQPYLDEELDVKPFLQFSSDNTTFDPQLTTITEAACTWVQTYLDRPIPPTQFYRFLDGGTGWNGAYLSLPYYPVLQIISVNEWWGGSGPNELTAQTPEDQVNGYTIDAQTGLLSRVMPGLIEQPFFPGARNIEVRWIAGYNPIPRDIRMATLQLINEWYSNTQEAPRMAGPLDEYDTQPTIDPGIPQLVYRMLAPYKRLMI